jgi:type IV pilus assembly protein PilA
MKNRKQGFTLVEIMIVVMIIGLLAAIAIPGFQKAREAAQTNGCINNLRVIEGAMDTYALENNQATGYDVGMADLVGAGSYIDETPTCPAGGTYDVPTVGIAPTCTITGHTL